MIKGVEGGRLLAGAVGKIPARLSESDHGKSCTRLGSVSGRTVTEDELTLNRQRSEPLLTYAASSKAGRCRDCALQTLRNLVARILQDQRTADRIDDGDMETIALDGFTPEQAKALVANDGYWKPDQTAARIFSFSVTISRNDPEKLHKIKENIIEGFQLAKESFGGELPEISSKTFSAVMGRLDDWAEKA